MAFAKATPNIFYAADGDSLAPDTTTFGQPDPVGHVQLGVVDKNNVVVRTNMTNASVGAGTQTLAVGRQGRLKHYVPDGTYYSVTTAPTSAGTYLSGSRST